MQQASDRLSRETKTITKAKESRIKSQESRVSARLTTSGTQSKKAKRMHAIKPSSAGTSEIKPETSIWERVPTPNDANEIRERPHCTEKHEPCVSQKHRQTKHLVASMKRPKATEGEPWTSPGCPYDPNALNEEKANDVVERKQMRERHDRNQIIILKP